VTGSRATSSCASLFDRSTSPPLQEATRAQSAVVARKDIERRAACFAGTPCSVVALAAQLSCDDFVTQADPALHRALCLRVFRIDWHFSGFKDAASCWPDYPPTGEVTQTVGKAIRKRACELAKAGAARPERNLEDDLDRLGSDRPW
jgi:hypothetical protein